MLEDWNLIESTFATQYHKSRKDISEMSYDEFITLLTGTMPETPLGKIVSIRMETDREVIKKFNKEQKKIHSDWQKKMSENKSSDNQEKDLNNFIEGLKRTFG